MGPYVRTQRKQLRPWELQDPEGTKNAKKVFYSKSTVWIIHIFKDWAPGPESCCKTDIQSRGLPLHCFEGLIINCVWLFCHLLRLPGCNILATESKMLLENDPNQFLRCCFLFSQASILCMIVEGAAAQWRHALVRLFLVASALARQNSRRSSSWNFPGTADRFSGAATCARGDFEKWWREKLMFWMFGLQCWVF